MSENHNTAPHPDWETIAFAAEISEVIPEIDLHGMRTNEAVHTLDQALHHAFMQGDQALRVIHGRGDGVLRRQIQDHLRKQAEIVAFFRDSTIPNQQGGVTVVVVHTK